MFTPPPPLPEELEAAQGGSKVVNKGPEGATGAEGAVAAGEGGSEGAGTGEGSGEGAGTGTAAANTAAAREAVLAANKEAGDPIDGFFTLEQALEGVEGEGTLVAEIVTPRGVITCELYEEVAPLTVANFAGLARGVRPFLDPNTDTWVTRPYYDATTFHRVIPGFMIQGGDPTGTRSGNPGYVIPDELDPAYIHDTAGILSMANRGANTGGSQFFLTLGPTPNLDGKHTVFGRCDESSIRIADDISIAPRDSADKPVEDEVVETIRIVRRGFDPER